MERSPPVQGPHSGQQVIQEMFRRIHATKELSEHERQRRIAWEQQQEARYAQNQASLEEMKMQLSLMQAYMNLPSTQPQVVIDSTLVSVPPLPAPSARIEELPVPVDSPYQPFTSPLTPEIEPGYTSSPSPPFIQGSSRHPTDAYTSPPSSSRLSPRFLPTPLTPRTMPSPRMSSSVTSPSPLSQPPMTPQPYEDQLYSPSSPALALPSPAQTPTVTPAQPPGRRKRRASALPEGQSRGQSVDENSDTEASKRRKNGHDTRSLTSQVGSVYLCIPDASVLNVTFASMQCVPIYIAAWG